MNIAFVLFLLLSSAALCVVPLVMRQFAEHAVRQRLAVLCGPPRPAVGMKDDRRSVSLAVLVRLGRMMLGGGNAEAKLAAELNSIGITHRDAATIVTGARLLLSLLCALVVLKLTASGNAPRNAMVAAAVMYVLPGMIISRIAASRLMRMRAELPVAIDVLVMALESGSGVEQALRFSTALAVHPAPLVRRAFRSFVTDLERGTPYDLCLLRLGERLGSIDGELFVEVLRQSLLFGTELVDPLRVFANDLRLRRMADARAAVGKATTMMTLVMVTCLMPALLALIGAPAVSGILQTLGKMK